MRAALRLAPLVFVRPVELRQARWSEFDLDAAEWRRPAELLKMRQPHVVPLATKAVDANATERSVRGVTGLRKLDAIHRPMPDSNRHSTHLERRAKAGAAELQSGSFSVEPAKVKLLQTRRLVESGWGAVHDALIQEGRPALARHVKLFVAKMAPPRTAKELIASTLTEGMRKPRAVEQDFTR